MNLEDLADRRRALAVACPFCGAPAGDRCVRREDGGPLERFPAHTSRLDAAGVVHAPIDSRELRGA